MALSVARDLDDVAARVGAWLRATRECNAVEVTRCNRPSDGLSSETLLVDARIDGRRESFVLRLPPTGPGAFPEYDLATQAEAQRVAAAHGVPTAVPADVVTDPQWFGAPFLVMPMIDGHLVGSVPIADEWVASATDAQRRVLSEHYVDAVASIHSIPLDSSGLVARRTIADEFTYWRRYLDWYGNGDCIVPALEDVYAWCVAHRPAHESDAVLLWGDVRLGNVIFADDRSVRAVLDWEMVSVGAPEHDLAWMLALEALANEMIGQAPPGFLTRAETIARYQAATGRTLCNLAWYEIFALFRSTAILSRITWINEQAGVPTFFPLASNPILDVIDRRIGEYDEESA